MTSIGDKSFTTQMVGAIETVVENSVGNDVKTNRYTAQVSAIDIVNSTVDVLLPGTVVPATGFSINGIQMPAINDYVIVYINESERWVDTVYRTATSSPYLSIAGGSLNAYGANNFGAPTGAVMAWLTGTAPTGWLFCDGTSYAYNTYPALGALLGGSAGGNFTVPDMRDRFIGGQSAIGTWSNTSGNIGPNTTMTEATHLSHTHTLDHTHADDFSQGAGSVAAHAAHYHTANPGEATTGDGSSFQGKVTIVASGSNASLIGHTHAFNAPSDITTQPEDSSGANISMTHTVTAGTLSGSVTALGVDATTANLDMTSTNANRTLKSTLLNFIIKT